MTVANLTRTFGVEMEVNTNRRAPTLANAINAEFAARGISQRCIVVGGNIHADIDTWKIVRDVTFNPGWEVVSPPMTLADGKAQLEAVCKVLQDLGAWVSRQTGLHVHHDARNLTGTQVGRAFATYATFQDLLAQMVAPSRRGNLAYSKPLSWARITDNGTDTFATDNRAPRSGHRLDTIESMIRHRVNGRSSTMNIEAVHRHGTIEFRQHQGSINAEKIFSWVLITQSIIESAVQGTGRILKPTSVIRAEGKPDAFRKRGEFARFRDTVGVSPSDNKVPVSQGNPSTWTPEWQAVPDACNAFYVPAFRYFAKVVKKFAAS